ncbi:hypothetical protein Ae201684P_006682 [Aphanomyces euteiches]|nr:hypothetical protein Ae201684P_006682 [Aphanomyces euteiches]
MIYAPTDIPTTNKWPRHVEDESVACQRGRLPNKILITTTANKKRSAMTNADHQAIALPRKTLKRVQHAQCVVAHSIQNRSFRNMGARREPLLLQHEVLDEARSVGIIAKMKNAIELQNGN